MAAHARSAVIAFGRFNPPTSGHKLLFDYAVSSARRLGADLIVYPSVSQDARSNPLPFSVKVKFLQKLFPRITFNTDPSMRTPFDAFKDVAARGYQDLYVVMGGERAQEFEKLGRYFKRPGERGYDASKHIPMGYHILGIPRRDQKTVSGTAQRQRAARNDFPSFLRGSADPKRQDVIRDLFAAVRQGMHVHESHKLHRAVARHSFRMPLVEQLNEGPVVATMSDRLRGAGILYKTFTQKTPPHSMHKPEDIVNAAVAVFTAPNARHTPEGWNLAGQMLRKMDELGIRWNKAALRPMTKRALRLEAEGSGAPKPPSEVDRLKVRQNQEKIELQRRQGNELMAAKLRDVQQKAREQQQKASAPKPASR